MVQPPTSPPFEDVFPIEDGGFSIAMLVYQLLFSPPPKKKTRVTGDPHALEKPLPADHLNGCGGCNTLGSPHKIDQNQR